MIMALLNYVLQLLEAAEAHIQKQQLTTCAAPVSWRAEGGRSNAILVTSIQTSCMMDRLSKYIYLRG